ncbi:hypothetical protein ATK36_5351 [Amycolatopsis sulphurea]|uniref:Uncharacterized protein n=1 Tax=Amycolatopsis sulphurea TaxID=76022 RepID=A0A2A9FI72_9PSEU|nr:hypothetical protein [Amycolatopsis sulphurea]PFG50145.1 hypothetical protein ATK36_5351 [Amycolatopsis sulphurea]
MTRFESTVDCLVLRGARAGVGLGYTLEAAAVRLADDIAELRVDGGLPAHMCTVITVLPQQRVLEIRVEGLSVEADPDRTTIREVTHALFELASYHNIVALDATTPPFFTQRILFVDREGRPFSAMIGSGIGDVESLTSPPKNQPGRVAPA